MSGGGKYTVNTGKAKNGDVLDFSSLERRRPRIQQEHVKSFEEESILRGYRKAVYACKFEPLYGDLLAS